MYSFSDFESTNYFPILPSSVPISKVNRPSISFSMAQSHPYSNNFYIAIQENQIKKKNIRRRRRRQNDGILRLAVTDNINVLRARLLAELRRRQQLARQDVQNRLNTIG